MSLQDIWSSYHHGEKQNQSHYKAYWKGCVHYQEAQAELLDDTSEPELDVTTTLLVNKQLFEEGEQQHPFQDHILIQKHHQSLQDCWICERQKKRHDCAYSWT